jgi:hypothetical protein
MMRDPRQVTPDPLDRDLEAEERRDVTAARRRGAQLYTLAHALVTELVSSAYLPSKWSGPARVICFHVCADHLYGDATAIDVPRHLADDAEKGSR